jgi:hypothetical protein
MAQVEQVEAVVQMLLEVRAQVEQSTLEVEEGLRLIPHGDLVVAVQV